MVQFDGCSANRLSGQSIFGSLVHACVFRLGCALHARFVNGKLCGEFRDLFADVLFGFGVAWLREDVRDLACDHFHFRFLHAAGGDGRSAETNAARLHWGKGIERNGIFVDGNSSAVERFFRVVASDSAGVNFDKKKMIVGSSGNDAKTVFGDCGCEGFGVFRDLLLVFLKS